MTKTLLRYAVIATLVITAGCGNSGDESLNDNEVVDSPSQSEAPEDMLIETEEENISGSIEHTTTEPGSELGV